MRVLLAIPSALLMTLVLVLVAIALGPVALLIAALIGTALVVVVIWSWVLESNRPMRSSRGHH